MAYLALTDLTEEGAEIIPSPPARSCEAVIPTIDPLLLRGSIVATRDTGAYNFWSMHPLIGGSREVTAVLLDSPLCEDATRRSSELDPSRAYYGLLQLIVLLRLLSYSQVKQRPSEKVVSIKVVVDGRGLSVPSPKVAWGGRRL